MISELLLLLSSFRIERKTMGNRVPGSGGQQQQTQKQQQEQQKRRTSSDVRDFFRRNSRQRANNGEDGATQPPTGAPCNYPRGGGKINASCPDLVRADPGHRPPSKTEAEERPVKLKIYRSYNDIAAAGPSTELTPPKLEIRVYRRSTEGLAASAGKAISLPRGMERTLTGADSDTSNGTDYRPASRQCTSAIDARSSRRGSSRCSVASIGYRGQWVERAS